MSILDFFKNKEEHRLPFLQYFEVHLADHCNLNCQACLHFSPLAKEHYTKIEDFEKDFKRLSELTAQNVESMSLMGGEPLLNPNCKEFFYIARKYFYNTYIQFVTNGILLNSQDEEFWWAMSENNIILRPTKYPIEIDWQKIEEKVKKYNIKLDFYNNPKFIKTSYKVPIVTNGSLDKEKNYGRCGAKGCVMLSNGKLYPCSIPSNIHHLIDYFNLKIPNDKKNGIDIHKVRNFDEIEKFMKKPIPLCKYCKGSEMINLGVWKRSRRNIKEWVE